MQKIFLLVGLSFLLGFTSYAFPNDAKTFTFDSTNNTTCSTTSSVLMPAVSNYRTILQIQTENRVKTNPADVHVGTSELSYPNNLLYDLENDISGNVDLSHVQPPNTVLTCNKSGAITDHVWFKVIYVDYNLASSTNVVYCNNCGNTSSSTTLTYTPYSMSTTSNDIGVISVRSTSTAISATTTLTEMSYSAPILLFIFIAVLFFVCVKIYKIYYSKRY